MQEIEIDISILIVEDNPADAELLEAHLENTHLSIHKVTVASTIAEGISYLKQESFSLIFLDFFLPDCTGLESYIELTKINAKIPVIMLSGLSDTALSLKAIALGAQDFLLKGAYTWQSLEKSVWYSIERKKNLELLKENNERYDIISKATNDIIWDWDLVTGKVKWIGQGLKNYLPAHIGAADIPGDFWVNGLHPAERDMVIADIHKAIARGTSYQETDYRFLKNDGTYAHINSRGYVIKDDQQKAVRMIGSMQDITERKNAELETQNARFAAEAARKTQEEFLANMSHEIRTPMNGVIGMTHLLAGTVLSDDQKEYVETIKVSASNLMVIINDILDLTKIIAGKITLEQKDYSLTELISNSLRINQCRADEKGIALKSNIDAAISQVLSGDPGRLNQVLINLVGNAIKFTEQGAVCVNVKRIKEDQLSVDLEFSVEDTGIGIAEDKMESVFERFTQLTGNNTRKYGGTGLGLTITKQLIELQGGSIHATSKQGKGSVFTFYLNIQKGKLTHSKEKEILKEESYSLNGINILLAEDNIINQKVAVRILTNLGARLVVANNGKEVIDLLREKKFDIILMDIQMPVMDGYESTRIIRSEMGEGPGRIPIIAMTASALIADREKCIMAGMDDYIAKPFQVKELCEKILMHLEVPDVYYI